MPVNFFSNDVIEKIKEKEIGVKVARNNQERCESGLISTLGKRVK